MIEARPYPDWVIVYHGKAWITGVNEGLAVYDSRTGEYLEAISIDGSMCAAPAIGFGAIWLPTCGNRMIHRVDINTHRVSASLSIAVPDGGEFTIGADERGVWAIADDGSHLGCRLVRIDPTTNSIATVFDVPDGGGSVRAGLGGVWVAYFETNRLLHVDPRSGEIVAEIPTGLGPRFMGLGEGSIWVMNQGAGSVSRIDPSTNEVVATIQVDDQAIEGGDLTIGDSFVWLRGSQELVAQIDPRNNEVIARYGAPSGSGSAGVGDGQLWISAHDVNHIYRLPFAL